MSSRTVERRIVTVLFADLVGFTSLSERLDAEDVSMVQDAYFDVVRETIERHGGLVEKFVGDAVMAVFGAPRVRDDDAERAVHAGLALVTAVARLGSSIGLEEGALRLRVGVNSGETVYGAVTPDRGPITGDAVNVAARLQTAADPESVVVGELTALAIADAFELEPLDALQLKGKAKAVRAWRAVGMYPLRSRERALGGLRAPMVGRDAEFEQLLEMLGSGLRRVVVAAPPGVGKTRLLDEFAVEAARRGARVLRARLRPDLLSPFEPVGQLVRSAGDPALAADRLVAAGVARSRAAVVQDALASVVAPVAGGARFREERDHLFTDWLEGLDALAEAGVVVWLVEDLHWASGDLLSFLEFAGLAPARAGRLIVGTTRPTLLESAAAWCASAELLDLRPLPDAETVSLVHALVGDALPPNLVEQIAERSGGNALFVEELLRAWASTGVLTQEPGGTWNLLADAQEVTLPATVQAIYAGQLDDLPPTARLAARRASVAGRRFPIAAFGPLGVIDGEEAIGTLLRRSLVGGPSDDPILGPSYVYRHALLRDAGYASLARGERATLHRRIADWLAGHASSTLPTLAEVIARHYAAAVESAPSLVHDIDGSTPDELQARAADWFERASEVASQFAAWESARMLAARSVELTHERLPMLRGRRLERLAEATANTVGVEVAEQLLRETLELYRCTVPDDTGEARAGLASAGATLGHLLRAQTRFEEAAQLASHLLAEIGAPEDTAVARLLLLRSRAVLNAWDDYDRARGEAERALDILRAVDHPELELEALELTAEIATERGEYMVEAWATIEDLARRAGQWGKVAAAIRTRAAQKLDDTPDEALPLLDTAAEICEAHGLIESRGWCDYALAEAHLSAGTWDEALECGLRAIAVGEAYDYHRVVVRSWFVLLPIARARGRDDLIRQSFARFDARRGREPDSHYARMVVTATHLHYVAVGLEPMFVPDVDASLASFDLDHAGPSWLAAVETVVEAWLEAADYEAAERALDRMKARLEHGAASRLARATESLLRARLLLALDRKDDAIVAGERTLAAIDAGAPWSRAKAIRILEEAGGVTAPLIEEARAIEAGLGIPATSRLVRPAPASPE